MCRSAGGSLTGAKTADAQAAYESANTIMPTVQAVNFVLHAGGWMEGGLVADYAKLLLDADQLTMMQSVVDGIDVSDNGQAMDALTRPAPASTSSAPATEPFERPFGARRWPTIPPTSGGLPKVLWRAIRVPARAPSRCWRPMRRPNSTPPPTRRCAPSSQAMEELPDSNSRSGSDRGSWRQPLKLTIFRTTIHQPVMDIGRKARPAIG